MGDEGMPGSRRRTRTSSSSSVEIQVTEKVVTVSSSASTPGSAAVARAKDTVTTSSPLPLVRPIPGFLRLIQTVGAQGTASLHGELFTLKQLCGYLTSYVKHRQLWDPLNPVVVHCGKDPLGQVFQVDRFTLHDAIGLIKRSVVPLEIDHQGWTKPAGVLRGGTNVDQGRDLPYSLHQAPSVNREVIVSPSTSFARSDAGEDVADGKGGNTGR
ncbi:hypothetical protein NP493_621g02004 [Ridgeia piscesae]|uniref:DM2 domain-containing protein n=1 Tax=Ridgeia piscesae TaxID=27915 RepID=A0AAD9KT85_RIDPI|nr:hypothetical protein NP493_621g02004 [Ridgeia piscesae]